jgi:hypothetical protein
MSLFLPPGSSDFERRVAVAVNALLRRSLAPSATAPANPQPGDAYFDTGTSIGKVWDGSAWRPLW